MKRMLESKVRDELNLIARKLQLKGYRSLTKNDLISAILECNESCVRRSLSATWWDRYHNHVYGWVGILGLILSIVFFRSSCKVDPFSQRVGALVPKYPGVYTQSAESQTGVGMDQSSGIFAVQLNEGAVLQPLGRYAPFSVRRGKGGLLISAIVHSLDGKVIAQIQDNQWLLNPNHLLRNFDRSALEVIDEYGIPVLQVEYLDAQRLKLGGVFHLAEKETSEAYPGFPSTPKDANPRAVISFRGVILIVGKNGVSMAARDISPEELRAKAGLIEPWFDYSKPDRLGVRRNE
jgi:hypothetical protein